ncbi:MAG: T9SS type A sorting domain-containing protein [Chitinophagaceae bacterium]|nr:MAG: T9SS type A sorting domain-containing protein [Chitinophagaceae bacterium]
MKISFTFLLSILLSGLSVGQTQTPVYLSQTIPNASSKGFYRYLPADYATSTKSYPLIIWVHGAGQVGQGTATELPKVLEWGLPKIISEGGFPSSFNVNGTDHSFIVISPQFMGWPSGVNVGAMINYVSNNYRVDAERIYLMGISAGGGGVWDYASISVANSDRVAAMIPFCGTLSPTQTLAGRIAASKMPVWAFHNTNDGTVPVANSRNWVNYINSYVPAPTPAAKLTEFPVQSNNAVIAHECWSLATLPSYKPQGINIYEWLLQYKRRTTVVNAAPVARAGNDTSIVLPATARLNGDASTDADGIIATYRWRKVSGPATHSFSDSTTANTVVSNLSPGVYNFELRVTDNGAAIATDNITVSVYAAFTPGTNQRVLIDVGAGATTASPSINNLYWNNITDARPGIRLSNAITTLNLPSGLGVNIINRLDGTYSTSSNGMATGNTTGIVNDYPANATTDLALIHSSATNGLWRITGMSSNKVYTIKFWGSRTNTTAQRTAEIKRADETTWKSYTATSNTNYDNAAVFIISGKTEMDFNIRTKSGSDFSALGVIDILFGEEGGSGPPAPLPNNAPSANAGSNTTLQLPTDSTVLNGCGSTDPEGAALKFKWTKISGPGSFSIVNDTLCQTRLRGLIAGTYQFELAVTDTGALIAKDTVSITIQPMNTPWPPVYTPLCSDPYKIVILGSSTAYGTGASPVDSSWARKLARYVTLQNAAASVVNLGLPGYNSYHLMPTGTTPPSTRPFPVDTTHNITQALRLNPQALIVNLPSNDIAFGVPVAEVKANFETLFAKADSAKVPVWFTTTQPRNNLSPSEKAMQVELKDWILQRFGNKAVDFWTNIAAAGDSIAPLYSANDGVHVNNAGHHLFFTRIVEEKIWDSICLRKNAAPIAVAGNDISISGTSATAQLNGGSSYDPEGGALTYQWTILSGAGASFNNSTLVNPVFTSVGTGQFTILLTVKDEEQLTGTDTLLISVTAPNILPVANAGADRVHNLPPNSLQLVAGATDADGSIAAYKWRKISGPTLTFVNDAVANVVLNNLVSGIYQLELMVTDNSGGIGKDTLILTVNAAPVANAGTDINITGTSANLQLNGSASTDPEAGLLSYAWSIVSGTGGSLTAANTANPQFISGSEGVYLVELRVTDPYSSSALDTVKITIAAANIAPVANAGSDKLIQLPASSTTLNGTSSYDPDGNITAYKWRKIAGPNMVFSNDAVVSPTVSSLTYGNYQFELVVTDNRGGIAKDSMVLIVNSPPSANAGSNATITLPANTTTLNGSASTDVDGTISYAWTQLGAGASIANPSAAQTLVTFAGEGTYNFQLTVTDNRGATSTASVTITVLPVPSVSVKTLKVNIFGGTNPYNNAQWNNWNVVSSLTSARFNYDDGTASNINAVLTAYGLIADNGATYATGATACPPAVLRYTSANTSYRTLTFNGMSTSKTYNLEFYGSRANTGNSSVFQIGNRYDTISTDNNANDVARFTDIAPDASGRIVVTISRIGTWNYLSGFVVNENTSTSFARTPTAVEQVQSTTIEPASNLLMVHPNPVVNIITVNIPDDITGEYKLSLVTVAGKVISQRSGRKTTNGQLEKLDVSNLPKGMYMLKLTAANQAKTTTIIKL